MRMKTEGFGGDLNLESGSQKRALHRICGVMSKKTGLSTSVNCVRRGKHGMKLPDAIILATAQSRNCLLISQNTKDFAGIAGVVSPYQL